MTKCMKCCRGMVYALSLGDTFDMGFVHSIHSKEWERSTRDPSSSSSRFAKMLKREIII